jgi:hypothetical protein
VGTVEVKRGASFDTLHPPSIPAAR